MGKVMKRSFFSVGDKNCNKKLLNPFFHNKLFKMIHKDENGNVMCFGIDQD